MTTKDTHNPLRGCRIAAAALFWTGITLLILDISGVLHHYLGWMARVQLLPAVMALNVGVIAALAVMTLLFGRIYCSVICPLGVLQDAAAHLRPSKRRRYTYSHEVKWLRYGTWLLFVVSLIVGVHAVVALLAPYSAYGRIVHNLLQPVYIWVNNALALLAGRLGSYALYGREVWMRSLPTLIVAAGTLAVIVILAIRGGRTWCNTICPVGTTLGVLSRVAIFRPVIDASKCRDCKACERKCKASCIDISTHSIDGSRCVDCFNCLDTCKFGALKYRFAYSRKSAGARTEQNVAETTASNSRRAFIGTSAMMLRSSILQAQVRHADGGLAAIEDKKVPVRQTPVTPPGSVSAAHMYDRCTACQLCVAACPNGVLRPSTALSRLMQPEASFERGWCRPECTRCSEVCPAGAILRIDTASKTTIQTGHAVVLRDNCIPLRDAVSCGNCARHCPTGAIIMVPSLQEDPDSVQIPTVDESKCIGCGACENLCPARPLSAIYVEGYSVHRSL